ncbi:MAG TPA: response regulator transcription factor [Clostridiaceae bacterium]|nr:response regulator transcription factor [Clostridiaceae bacterium]
MKKVLVVDDDPNIVEVLRLYFDKDGFAVISCLSGDRAVDTFMAAKPDLVVLDLMLPGKDGYDICREIRKTSDVPIIMLTARTDTLDKVVGLELGADDYVQKPFEPKELLARVKAVLRRVEKKDDVPAAVPEQPENAEVVQYKGLTVDKARYVVLVDEKETEMPPKELELLFFLASHPNRVFTREQLLENVWGYDFYGESRTVDVHVKRIREKIESPDRDVNWQIKTVWGVGYKFEASN